MQNTRNKLHPAELPSIQEYFLTQTFGDCPDQGSVCSTDGPDCAELHLSNLGATIMGLTLPLASGKRDVILGFAKPEDYLVQEGNLGGLIGRVAGRIPVGPEGYPLVKIDGQVYPLSANAGTTCLHGGEPGFHREIWALAEEGQDATRNWLTFRLLSPDGDAGFPGDLEVFVTYSLEKPVLTGTPAGEACSVPSKDDPTTSGSCLDLRISYQATCSAPTVCSLTQHAYFNLQGHDQGDLLGQSLQVTADAYTDFTDDLIATGDICPLEGTVLDLRQGKDLGQLLRHGLGQVASESPTVLDQPGLESKPGQPSPTGTRLYLVDQPDPHLTVTRGLDHNYILSQEAHHPLQKVACLACDDLRMEVLTTFPGLQVYTANYLDTLGKPGKDGQPTPYPPHSAVCLECQAWPNAANLPDFPSIRLEPGQIYQQETVYRFSFAF
ncbi:MAG: aldose epimerase family protein [Eubacteriales bacterium]|nr:galactose mutarotase [Clostridiales bacterium]MDY5836558.1 aldose epimerase family protein [Eubacteriales bacterium]